MTSIEIMKIALNVCEGLASLSGFIYWRKIKNTSWKWFPFYLLLILLAELLGKYMTRMQLKDQKIIMYNYLVIPGEILFYLFMFRYEFRNLKAVKIPLYSMIVYLICFLTDQAYLTGKYRWFFSFSYTVGVLLIVINILIFLFQLMVMSGTVSYRSNFVFWICLGLLLFYLGSLPFYGIFNSLYGDHKKSFMSFAYLFYTFDYLMYLSFVIAFVWGKLKSQDSLV